MEVFLHQTFSIPHQAPKKVAKRSMAKLPNFLCHCYEKCANRYIIFAGNERGEIYSWNWDIEKTGTFMEAKFIGKHDGAVKCITFHPFHRLLITGSSDQSIKIWDVFGLYSDKNTCLQTILGHNSTVLTLGIHYELIISGSSDKTVRVWAPEDGRREMSLYPWFFQLQVIKFNGWVSCMWTSPKAVSGDLGELYVGDMNGNISIFKSIGMPSIRRKIVKFNRIDKCKMRKRAITHVLLIPNYNLMITSSFDNIVEVSDARGKVVYDRIENPRRERFVGVAWNMSQEEIILVDSSGVLDVYQYKQKKFANSLNIKQANPTFVNFHLMGQLILVSGRTAIQCFKIERQIPFLSYEGHTGPICGIFVDDYKPPEGKVVSAGHDNKICIWGYDKFSLGLIDIWKEEKSEIYSFSFDKLNNIVICGLCDGSITVWNMENGNYHQVSVHENTTSCITCFIDTQYENSENYKNYIISGGFDGTIGLVDITFYKKANMSPHFVHCQKVHPCEILSIHYNEMDGTILSGDNDGIVKIWKLVGSKSLVLQGELHGHSLGVTNIVRDGYFVFTGSEDCTIIMWDSRSREKLRVLKGHEFDITFLQILENGNLLSCSRDGCVYMWDYLKDEILFKFKKNVEILCFMHNKEFEDLFVGCNDGNILRIHVMEKVKKEEIIEKEEEDFSPRNDTSLEHHGKVFEDHKRAVLQDKRMDELLRKYLRM